MEKLFIICFVLIASLSLAACGFQLRRPVTPALTAIKVDSTVDSHLARVLIQALALRGLCTDTRAASVTLRILAHSLQRQAISFDSGHQIMRYILVYTLQYQLTNLSGTPLVMPQTIRASRSLVIRANQLNADLNTQHALEMGLQDEIIQQLINRLTAPALNNVLHAQLVNAITTG